MAKIQQLRDESLEKIFLRTSLDAIYTGVDNETSILSNGKIKAEVLDVEVNVADGTNSGIVYNSDTSRLTITSGGLSINAQTNIGTASTTEEKAKLPTAGAVQSYISSSNVIPSGSINGLSTAITNGASSYVHSNGVIPTSAVSGFDTAAKNAASTYVNSNSVIPVSAVSNFVQNVSSGVSSYVYMEGGNCIPQSAVSGLTTSLGGKIDASSYESTIQLGFGMEYQNDNEIGMAKYRSITNVTGASVYIEAGEAYVIDATTSSKTINYAGGYSGQFGLESHIELFVANEGYVHTGSNVTLVDPLEPDAVNNLTVRFHDGHAILSVEDHAEAYMVNNTSTGATTSGTFAYGLKQATSTTYNYIGFRSELNTSSIPTGGQSATVMKHIVGNGMTVGPTITGNLIVKSGATLRDIKANGLVVMSGTAKLTDVLIDSGATVSVGTGGGLTIDRVYGNGGVIDLGGTHVTITSGTTAHVSNCVLSGGSSQPYNQGGAFLTQGTVLLDNVTISGNKAVNAGGAMLVAATGYAEIRNSIVSGNTVTFNQQSKDVYIESGTVLVKDSTVGNVGLNIGGTCIIDGNTAIGAIAPHTASTSGFVTISSGAILDLTGNTNATPIAPGGGITFASGGATVYPSAGQAIAYFIAGATVSTITNKNTVTVAIDPTGFNFLPTGSYKNVTMQYTVGGLGVGYGNTLTLEDARIESPNGNLWAFYLYLDNNHGAGHLVIKGNCSFECPIAHNGTDPKTDTLTLENNSTINFTNVRETDVLVKATTMIIGIGCSVILRNGSTVSLTGGTYTQKVIDSSGNIVNW